MLLLIDLEYNKTIDLYGNNFREIIQVGCLKIDYNGNIINEYISYVKPKVCENISDEITKLTGIDDSTLLNERYFDFIYKEVNNLCRDVDFVLGWGDDFRHWDSNCSLHSLENLIASRFINYQEILKKKYNIKNIWGLEKLINQLEVKCKNNHNALDDTYCFYEILKYLGFNNNLLSELPYKKNKFLKLIMKNNRYVFIEKVLDVNGICFVETEFNAPSRKNKDSWKRLIKYLKPDIDKHELIYDDLCCKEFLEKKIKLFT